MSKNDDDEGFEKQKDSGSLEKLLQIGWFENSYMEVIQIHCFFTLFFCFYYYFIIILKLP